MAAAILHQPIEVFPVRRGGRQTLDWESINLRERPEPALRDPTVLPRSYELAYVPTGERHEVVLAIARVSTVGISSESIEVAIEVAERWRGLGVGTTLLFHISDGIARMLDDEGAHETDVVVRAPDGNETLLRILAKLRFCPFGERDPDGSTWFRYTIRVQPPRIARAVAERARQSNHSQADIAFLAGAKRATVSLIVSGQRTPGSELLQRLSFILTTTEDERRQFLLESCGVDRDRALLPWTATPSWSTSLWRICTSLPEAEDPQAFSTSSAALRSGQERTYVLPREAWTPQVQTVIAQLACDALASGTLSCLRVFSGPPVWCSLNLDLWDPGGRCELRARARPADSQPPSRLPDSTGTSLRDALGLELSRSQSGGSHLTQLYPLQIVILGDAHIVALACPPGEEELQLPSRVPLPSCYQGDPSIRFEKSTTGPWLAWLEGAVLDGIHLTLWGDKLQGATTRLGSQKVRLPVADAGALHRLAISDPRMLRILPMRATARHDPHLIAPLDTSAADAPSIRRPNAAAGSLAKLPREHDLVAPGIPEGYQLHFTYADASPEPRIHITRKNGPLRPLQAVIRTHEGHDHPLRLTNRAQDLPVASASIASILIGPEP